MPFCGTIVMAITMLKQFQWLLLMLFLLLLQLIVGYGDCKMAELATQRNANRN